MTKSTAQQGMMTAHDAAELMQTQLTMKTPPTSGPALNARKRGPSQYVDTVDGVPHRRIVYDRDEIMAYCRRQQPLDILLALAMRAEVVRLAQGVSPFNDGRRLLDHLLAVEP